MILGSKYTIEALPEHYWVRSERFHLTQPRLDLMAEFAQHDLLAKHDESLRQIRRPKNETMS